MAAPAGLAAATAGTEYDILIITDSTGSMTDYLRSLKTSLPEILALSALSGSFGRLGVMAYTDYSLGRDVVTWSGWNKDVVQFAKKLNPIGNHDTPEASKSALIYALDQVDEKRKTVVLWYTDAPPHHASEPDHNTKYELLAHPNCDWVQLANKAVTKNCTVFAFTDNMSNKYVSFWAFLAQLTGGMCLSVKSTSSVGISRLTLDILLAFMNETPEMEPKIYTTEYHRFEVSPTEANPQPTDEGNGSQGYLPPPTKKNGKALLPISVSAMTDFSLVPRWSKKEPLELAKRFLDQANSEYRQSVFDSLAQLIDTNVVALTYNPIFGTLWRAVCKERLSQQRDKLVNLFSQNVAAIQDGAQQATMKEWLEASYDSSAAINEIMEIAPDHGDPNQQRMYLDMDADVHLTRMELLEVARSCYPGVLEKLARIFTHAKLVEPGVVLTDKQRSIPISLPPAKLFEVLPHLVVPGTLFSFRAAALMAVLALVVGVPFLKEPAIKLLSQTKGTWLNVDVPENISYECAKFLLSCPEGIALNDEERAVYSAMRRYRMLELNIDATLTANVPWTPEKSRNIGDIMVECSRCKIKRSVTMMREDMDNVCGMCWCVEEDKKTKNTANSRDPLAYDNKGGELESCWVECSVRSCRAHYVIQAAKALNVRPKCYYCRTGIPCPFVECHQCHNRVIIPTAYRKDGPYSCPACSNAEATKRKTIVDQETSARVIISENGVSWLGLTQNTDLFINRSGFKLFSAHGAKIFRYKKAAETPSLVLDWKPIQNVNEVLGQTEDRVGTGKIEYGSCSLCFDDMPYSKLMPACGRSGCNQRVDEQCLQNWYSANRAGGLLNLMRLTCPFCRRRPTSKIMARFNKGAASLCGLQEALQTRGWFYAWCGGCNFAKPAVERACCDGDRVPAIQNFTCEDCIRRREEQRARLLEEARRLTEERIAAREERNVAREERLARLAQIQREVTALQVQSGGATVRITPCPACGVMVEKTYGCNHISCNCGAHFCHVCGKREDERDIYQHINDAHGGIFDEIDED